MILQDALDELRGPVLRDQARLKSGPDDHFWSDTVLIRYIRDAQTRFARLSLCIHDSTVPDCTQVKLKSGVATYVLHPSVVAIVSARHQDNTNDMSRVAHTIVNTQNSNTETFEFASNQPDGKPTQYSTDDGVDTTKDQAIIMRVYGTPLDTTNDTETGKIIYLRVCRKPLVKIDISNLQDELETPDDYCLDMLEWAAYRALRNADVDTSDGVSANDHKARFEEAALEARREVERKLFAPLLWQFGSNGFTYVHN